MLRWPTIIGGEYKSVGATLEKARIMSSSCSFKSFHKGGVAGIDVTFSKMSFNVMLTSLIF